jgi:hypothetical protein
MFFKIYNRNASEFDLPPFNMPAGVEEHGRPKASIPNL